MDDKEREMAMQREISIEKLKQKVRELKEKVEDKETKIKDPLRNQKAIIKHFGMSNRLR